MSKILFILKRREDYNAIVHSNVGLSTGLYNSASFVDDMLGSLGISSVLEVAKDNAPEPIAVLKQPVVLSARAL
mgnify:CR=1 FL=1